MATGSGTNKPQTITFNTKTITDLQDLISTAIEKSENVAELKALYKLEKALVEVLPFAPAPNTGASDKAEVSKEAAHTEATGGVFQTDINQEQDYQPRSTKKKNPNPKAQPSKGY